MLAVAGRVLQAQPRIGATYYIGKGKAHELEARAHACGASVIVFDNDLSPAQMRNLERLAGLRVLDRSAIVLDIFARHARTRSAMVQVELAQLEYLLPRLTRQWDAPLAPGRRRRHPGHGGDRRARPRRDAARDRPPPDPGPHPQPAARARPHRLADGDLAQGARRSLPRRARGIHQRRQVHPDAGALGRGGPRRGPPLRHPRLDHPRGGSRREMHGSPHRHRRFHQAPAPSPPRLLPRHPGGGGGGRSPAPRRGSLAPALRPPDGDGAGRARGARHRGPAHTPGVQQARPGGAGRRKRRLPAAPPPPGGRRGGLGPDRRGAR